ncbi:hypothetical protein HZB69_01100 [Candidatus Amesbacteria bacterium]|nr:hypothetical protein [Candidatus Amesbacteria bacterium]
MKNQNISKIEKSETGVVTQSSLDVPHKKNAPNLLSAIPGICGLASASLQMALGVATDYYDGITNERRLKELESFDKELDKRLSRLEIKDEAKEYWEGTVVFKREDIMRKLMTEPGKGFDVLLAEYVASALSDLSTPPTAKDLILSSLLSVDSVDIKVFLQIDVQFKELLRLGNTRGTSIADIVTLMKPAQIDEIMISRSIQRLESQDLIHPLNTNTASIQDLPAQRELLEGVKSPQYYSQGGFVISAFGRRFLRFLKLSN